jgi:hypothetical protein
MILGIVLGVTKEEISPNVISPFHTLLCNIQSFLPINISVNGRPQSLSKQRSFVRRDPIMWRVMLDTHWRKEEIRREESEEDEEKGGEKKFGGIIVQEHFVKESGDRRKEGEEGHV